MGFVGLSTEEAAAAAGAGRETARRWVVAAGGVKGMARWRGRAGFWRGGSGRRSRSGWRRSCRAGILRRGWVRGAARRRCAGRCAGNSVGGVYRAHLAEREALERARRPSLEARAVTRSCANGYSRKLMEDWSPEQISARRVAGFPGRPEMRVSAETIYQSLFVQGRGALRRKLAPPPADRAGCAPAAAGRPAAGPDGGHGEHQRAAGRGA